MATPPSSGYPNPPLPVQPAPPNWISRHIKLVIFGFLGFLLLFFVLIFGAVFGMLRGAEPVRLAVASAQASPQVREHLGEPISAGWFISGNIQTRGPEGHARLAIPIQGPKASATIYVIAVRDSGAWYYRKIHAVDGSWSADFGPTLPQLAAPGNPAPDERSF